MAPRLLGMRIRVRQHLRAGLMLVQRRPMKKLGNDAGAVLVPLAEWLVVHLVGKHRVREVVVLEC